MKRIRRYLVAGILVWAPLAVTYWLLKIAVGIMDQTLQWIPERYRPEELLGIPIPGLGVILTIIVLLLTGVLAANFVGRAFVGGWESLLGRVPVVRSIYSAAKNFAEMVFSDSSQSFKNVLLIEYPRKGLYSLAFQTSTISAKCRGELAKMWFAVLSPQRRTQRPASSSSCRRKTSRCSIWKWTRRSK